MTEAERHTRALDGNATREEREEISSESDWRADAGVNAWQKWRASKDKSVANCADTAAHKRRQEKTLFGRFEQADLPSVGRGIV